MNQLVQLDIFGPPPPAKSYWNTTELSGKPLIEAESTAKDQETFILAIFKENSPLSPSDVWRIFERKYHSILLTSIRRGITNLTNQNKLTKTNIQKTGVYKRPEYVWKINE